MPTLGAPLVSRYLCADTLGVLHLRPPLTSTSGPGLSRPSTRFPRAPVSVARPLHSVEGRTGQSRHEGHDSGNGRSLGRDITFALLLKFALLIALYLAFFSGDRRPAIDDAATARHLLAPGEAPR